MALKSLILVFLSCLQSKVTEISKSLKEGRISLSILALPSTGKTIEWKEPRVGLMDLSYLFQSSLCLGEREALALKAPQSSWDLSQLPFSDHCFLTDSHGWPLHPEEPRRLEHSWILAWWWWGSPGTNPPLIPRDYSPREWVEWLQTNSFGGAPLLSSLP